MKSKEVVDLSLSGRDSRNSSQGHFLRIAGPVGFVVIMLAALSAITAYSYFSSRRDALALSADVLGAIERRIAGELDAFLSPIEDSVQLTTTFLENAEFDVHNRDFLEPLAFGVLANLSQVANFIVADTQGNFFMVSRQRDGSLHTKIIERSANTCNVTWIRRDPDGGIVDEETAVDDSYDPRNRPWFTGAVNRQELSWTDLYVFFTSQTHGMTVSLPIMGENDERLGVFGLDIELKDISAFLETLKIGENGEAIIVDEDGYIVAHPDIAKVVKKEGDVFKPILVEELGNPILNRAYSRFRVEGHGHRDLVVDGRRYLSTAFLMPQKTGLDLSVFVFVPEEDFVGFVARNNRNILLMSAGVIILAAIMACLLVLQALRTERNTRQVLERQQELEVQSRVFSELSSKAVVFSAGDAESFRQLTEIVANSMRLRRTSLWRFEGDGRHLKCIDSYDRESNGHTQGTVLDRREFPELVDLLQGGQDIITRDAEMDNRLTELFRVYLQPLGCESLLAVPIRYQDCTIGALWFETGRMLRGWLEEDVTFAQGIANMLALRFSADDKLIPATGGRRSEKAAVKDIAALEVRETARSDDVRLDPSTGGSNHEVEPAESVSTNGAQQLSTFVDRVAAGGIVPEQSAADIFEDTAVMALRFTDPIILAGRVDDNASTTLVDRMVAYLEQTAASLGVEYIRILGEEIICAAGIDPGSKEHSHRIADLALSLQNQCTGLFTSMNTTMKFRIGIDTGAVMGCHVGRERKSYNIWGDAVSFASKMAESGLAGGIQVTQSTYQRLRATYLFQVRGRYYLPNIGETSTYLLTGRI